MKLRGNQNPRHRDRRNDLFPRGVWTCSRKRGIRSLLWGEGLKVVLVGNVYVPLWSNLPATRCARVMDVILAVIWGCELYPVLAICMVSHLNSSDHDIYSPDIRSPFPAHCFLLSYLLFPCNASQNDGNVFEIQNLNTLPLRPPSTKTYTSTSLTKSPTYLPFPSLPILPCSSPPTLTPPTFHSSFVPCIVFLISKSS